MAGLVKTTPSSNVNQYVITDVEGSTVTIVRTQSYGAGYTLTFASSGGLHQDGQLMMTNLMQQLSTGLVP